MSPSALEVSEMVLETIQQLQPHLEHWHEEIIPTDGSLASTFWIEEVFIDDWHRRAFVNQQLNQIRQMIAPFRDLPLWKRLVWTLEQLPTRIFHLRSPRTEQERALVHKPGNGVALRATEKAVLLKIPLPIPKSNIKNLVKAARKLHTILSQQPLTTSRKPLQVKPHWDGVILSFDGIKLRSYQKRAAPDQAAILAALQKAGWPDHRIVLPESCWPTLHITIKRINDKIKDRIIQLQSGGNGKSVIWKKN